MSSNLLQTGVPQKGKAIELAPYNTEKKDICRRQNEFNYTTLYNFI
jgi:hypothetical protein